MRLGPRLHINEILISPVGGPGFPEFLYFRGGLRNEALEIATQAYLLAKVQVGSPLLTMSRSVVVALMGSFVLLRSVLKKLEDAEMHLQVTVSVLPFLRIA